MTDVIIFKVFQMMLIYLLRAERGFEDLSKHLFSETELVENSLFHSTGIF
jgi:hypothetical protein